MAAVEIQLQKNKIEIEKIAVEMAQRHGFDCKLSHSYTSDLMTIDHSIGKISTKSKSQLMILSDDYTSQVTVLIKILEEFPELSIYVNQVKLFLKNYKQFLSMIDVMIEPSIPLGKVIECYDMLEENIKTLVKVQVNSKKIKL